jgi:hypothetical protein
MPGASQEFYKGQTNFWAWCFKVNTKHHQSSTSTTTWIQQTLHQEIGNCEFGPTHFPWLMRDHMLQFSFRKTNRNWGVQNMSAGKHSQLEGWKTCMNLSSIEWTYVMSAHSERLVGIFVDVYFMSYFQWYWPCIHVHSCPKLSLPPLPDGRDLRSYGFSWLCG